MQGSQQPESALLPQMRGSRRGHLRDQQCPGTGVDNIQGHLPVPDIMADHSLGRDPDTGLW